MSLRIATRDKPTNLARGMRVVMLSALTAICTTACGNPRSVPPGSSAQKESPPLTDVAPKPESRESPAAESPPQSSVASLPVVLPPTPLFDEATEAALASLHDFDYDDTPLKQVVRELRIAYPQVHWHVDQRAMEAIAVPLDTLISFRAKQIPLETGLRLILNDLSMTIALQHGSLVITSQTASEDIANYGMVRVYPVADLVKASSPDLEAEWWEPAAYEDLIDLINTTTAPTTWSNVGGSGVIKTVPNLGVLVIAQTIQAHREIEKLLNDLRAIGLQQLPRQASTNQPQAEEPLVLRTYRSGFVMPTIPRGVLGMSGFGGMASTRTTWDAGEFFLFESATAADAKTTPPEPGTSKPSAAEPPSTPPPPRPSAEEVAQLLPQVIEPQSWHAAGGRGTIHTLTGALVIEQTASVHAKINKLLWDLGWGPEWRSGGFGAR